MANSSGNPVHDPFETLGLPATFALTPAQIESAYLARSAMLHPDVDDDAQHFHAAGVNQARETLLHEESRADALLLRVGGPSRHDERGLPAGFLAAIMEVREQVDAARSARDGEAIERWRSWAHAERARHAREAATLFESGTDPATRTAIRRLLNAWRYIERLIEQLDPAAPDGQR